MSHLTPITGGDTSGDEFALPEPSRLAERTRAALPGVFAFLLVGPLAISNGGWDAPSWGWSAAAFATVGVLALTLERQPALSRREMLMVLSLLGLGGWSLASAVWSGDVSSAVLSTERLLVYVTAIAALALVARRDSGPAIAAGVLAAGTVVCADALARLVWPAQFALGGVADTGRIAAPVGYWNGVGILAAVCALLALGLAARAGGLATRLVAAATIPVLVVALYLSFSRGAWIALALGLTAAIVVDRSRWQLVFAAGAAALCTVVDVAGAATSSALTHTGSPVGATAAQSHRLAIAMVVSAMLLSATSAGIWHLEQRWSPTASLARAGRYLGIGLLLAIVLSPVAVYGSPRAAVSGLYNALAARPPGALATGGGHASRNLNQRLFNLSGTDRLNLWSTAWHQYTAHPVLGSGAGRYQQYWLAHRPSTLHVVNAHNLYLETLDELGPLGLVLLLVALATPLTAVRHARSAPIAAGLAGAYVAAVAHVTADWDWQLPGVMLAGLAAGVALTAAARPEARRRMVRLDFSLRWVAVAVLVLIAAGATFGLRVNTALSASSSSAGKADFAAAAAEARVATTWAPWMEQGWLTLGEAQLGQTRYPAAAVTFRHAIRIAPADWQAWYGLARAESGPARRRALHQALALDPREPVLRLLEAISQPTVRPA